MTQDVRFVDGKATDNRQDPTWSYFLHPLSTEWAKFQLDEAAFFVWQKKKKGKRAGICGKTLIEAPYALGT